jgi:hypothetical protein
MPVSLWDVYQNIITRIQPLAWTVLSWILHAKRPLLMEELRVAIALEDDDHDLDDDDLIDPRDIIRLCSGLVILDESSGIVRFIHMTVVQFLQAETANIVSTTDLASICLIYLKFDVFDQGPCKDNHSLKSRFQKYKLGQYAARYWADYVRGSGEMNSTLKKSLKELLRSPTKRSSMLQLQVPSESYLALDVRLFESQSILHILAKSGLAFICKEALNKGTHT